MLATTREMMEFLWLRRAKNLPPNGLAEVLDRLLWCMDDNGLEILAVRGEWLAGDDIGKVRVALSMSEVFPFSTREEMTSVFDRLVARWPEVRPDCERIIENWDRQNGLPPSDQS